MSEESNKKHQKHGKMEGFVVFFSFFKRKIGGYGRCFRIMEDKWSLHALRKG